MHLINFIVQLLRLATVLDHKEIEKKMRRKGPLPFKSLE